MPGNRRCSVDIAFTRQRLAVFVDGCYWHDCPEHGTEPRRNLEWWRAKFAANKARDADGPLARRGWVASDPHLGARRADGGGNQVDEALRRS
ncbi:hypothetical protein [Arsenicicoccus cauae]|uniref:hypothetical protein n=1 Tax=Arsenicicoccus cauae TaxID=2663847 RepID=UPI002899E282|nr:hypothetical protein [Arsenicicoccus cauae]